MDSFSDRDFDILFLMSEGNNYSEMAEELGISFSRVKTLVWELRDRMGVRNNEQAIATAYHQGILLPRVKANGS